MTAQWEFLKMDPLLCLAEFKRLETPWRCWHHKGKHFYSLQVVAQIISIKFFLKKSTYQLRTSRINNHAEQRHACNTVQMHYILYICWPMQLAALWGIVSTSLRPEATAVHSSDTWCQSVRQSGGLYVTEHVSIGYVFRLPARECTGKQTNHHFSLCKLFFSVYFKNVHRKQSPLRTFYNKGVRRSKR